MSITELRKALGDYVDKAREQPIGIIKHGETVAYIISPELFKLLELLTLVAKGTVSHVL